MTAVTTYSCDEPECAETTERIEGGWSIMAKSGDHPSAHRHFCPEHVKDSLPFLCPRCAHPDHLRGYCATENREKDCLCHYPYSA
jgi:hypothetical protein